MSQTEIVRYVICINHMYLYESNPTGYRLINNFKAGVNFHEAFIFNNLEFATDLAKKINGRVVKVVETEVEEGP